MEFNPRDPKSPLLAPKEDAAGKKKVYARGGRGRGGGQKQGGKEETEEHAREVKAVMRGQDIVESGASAIDEKPPAAFDGSQMQVVRSWMDSRPLEPKTAATAMVPYPRNWNSKRGRYCKFKAPGAGVYGILRARPTF